MLRGGVERETFSLAFRVNGEQMRKIVLKKGEKFLKIQRDRI
jgi:hypothetical protein